MGQYEVKRSITIQAQPTEVMNILSNLRESHKWSPWLILDPQTQLRYEGEAAKIGASYHWESPHIGDGSLTISQIGDDEIAYDLEFLKPWKSKAKVYFVLIPMDRGVEVTWTMHAHMPWFLFWMKKQMMAWIGMDFDRGLMLLKECVEMGTIPMTLSYHGVVETEEMPYVGLPHQATLETLPEVMDADFKGLLTLYPPTEHSKIFSITTKFDLVRGYYRFISAISDPQYQSTTEAVSAGVIPAGRAIKVTLEGEYKYLGNAWAMAMSHLRSEKLKLRKGIIGYEVYLNDPESVAPEELQTEVYIPVR